MNIGIFGGTFNPPHTGHINIAEIACKSLKLDKLIVIPTKNPPHKETDVSEMDRYNMAKLAFENIPCAEISDIEFKRQGKSYTLDTLLELKNTYKNDELYLIIGSDMYLDFDKWHEYENILQICKLAVFLRKVSDYDKIINYCKTVPAIIMENEPIDISSTEIRENNLTYYVSYEVNDYIKKHELYKGLK